MLNLKTISLIAALLAFSAMSQAQQPIPSGALDPDASSKEEKAKEPARLTNSVAGPAGHKELVPLYLHLPTPPMGSAFVDIKTNEHLAPLPSRPRPPLLVPPGVTNVSLGCPVRSSDPSPLSGALERLSDGIQGHESREELVVLHRGLQWVQLDLGRKRALYAVVFWHSKWPARVFHDVIVQVADDPDFNQNVRTLFNNDYDNTAGFGAGGDLEYWETFEGKLIEAKGMVARYIRLFSAGSTAAQQNTYLAIEAYGLPQ